MTARKKDSSTNTSSEDNSFTETTIKVGKALARSSFKVEDTSRRARKVAEDIVKTVSGRKSPSKPGPFQPAAGMTVEGQLGFVAGDIYQYLEERGSTPIQAVVKTMVQHGSTEAMAHAALGWLAREGKIAFSPDGATLTGTPG
jgi:hypothetical protein